MAKPSSSSRGWGFKTYFETYFGRLLWNPL